MKRRMIESSFGRSQSRNAAWLAAHYLKNPIRLLPLQTRIKKQFQVISLSLSLLLSHNKSHNNNSHNNNNNNSSDRIPDLSFGTLQIGPDLGLAAVWQTLTLSGYHWPGFSYATAYIWMVDLYER